MKRFLLLLASIVALLMATVTTVAAQEDQSGPVQVVVHRVDARTSPIEVTAIADDYSSQEVSVKENGKDKDVQVSALNQPQEIVFVVDTSQRLREGDALDIATSTFADQIRELPSGTSVGIVDAASSAIIVQAMTTDLAAAARSMERMDFSEGGKIFQAMDKAVAMLSEPVTAGESEAIQTLVVFAGGADAGSSVEIGGARAGLVRRGAQSVIVQYNGGEQGLNALTRTTGGLVFPAATTDDLVGAASRSVEAASNRFVIRYDGVVEAAERGDATLKVGSAQTSYSYGGAELAIRTIALAPSSDVSSSGMFSFLESQSGLYLTLLLAFLGIGLAIFGVGSIFGGGNSSLEGLLARYSNGGDDELDEEETNIVQTALVQRAVELSETFAEERGFLVKVEELLERAKLPLRPGEAMSFYVAGIFLGMVVGFFLLGGLIGSVIFGFVVAVGAIGAIRFMARRRMRQFEKQLPDTLQLLAGTLRAGYSLPQGLEAVSKESADPMGYELRRVMTEARLGRELEDALASAAERLNSPDFAWAVMAISIQREVGGNLNELLMTVSDTMVARERLKGEVATLTAEGKMSAILLGGLPPGLGVVMWIMNPDYINQLFDTFLGNVFLGLGVVSSLIGLAWMKKVITIDV